VREEGERMRTGRIRGGDMGSVAAGAGSSGRQGPRPDPPGQGSTDMAPVSDLLPLCLAVELSSRAAKQRPQFPGPPPAYHRAAVPGCRPTEAPR